MTFAWIACLLLIQSPAGDGPDAEQFRRIMNGLHSDVHDISFVFEGEAGLIQKGSFQPDGGFQGTYAFRSDGATLLDVFSRSLKDDSPVIRTIHAILRNQMESVSQIPDLGQLLPEKTTAIPGVLNRSLSAERILYYWYFMTLREPEAYGYQSQGWEDVDGHRCLKVQFDQTRRIGPAPPRPRAPRSRS